MIDETMIRRLRIQAMGKVENNIAHLEALGKVANNATPLDMPSPDLCFGESLFRPISVWTNLCFGESLF